MPDYPIGLPLEAARELMLHSVKKVDTEKVSSMELWQRVLAEDAIASENIPPFDKSPYDGYAFKAEDICQASETDKVTLRIIGEIPAGSDPVLEITTGTAAKIFTGAPIPKGADTVIPYEKTEFTNDTVTFSKPAGSGRNIITAGEDIAKGDLCAKKGERITTTVMSQLAGLGFGEVLVYKKLKVAYFCTGSELVSANEALKPGKIRNTNDHMLMGYFLEEGISPCYMGVVKDEVVLVAEKLKVAACEADCVITTGGASVGDYDVMREAILLAGGEVLFWKVKMKPGSAVVGGLVEGKPVFCLSGNPGAAATTLQLLAMPVLRYMMGMTATMPAKIQVRMLHDFNKKSPNRRIIRGRLVVKNGMAYFLETAKQANGMTSAMRDLQVCVDVPAGTDCIEADTICFAYDLEHIVEK